MTETDAGQAATPAKKEFNYCFWSKLLVGIPAVPLAGVIAASPFTQPLTKLIAAAAGCGAAVYLAIWIDRLPCLAGKVVKKKP